ncbi:MAG TPA: MFS transporter [Rhodobacteraceae bacterium]|jgi:predicted MFS family arabinose efflux permease|nr:MFS transporter [Paracoccaceae bacterium]HBV56034.1 MFS transporter [Paracoccaceae bacterium]
MILGLVFLCGTYVFSQFFRAFLAVLAEALKADLGAGADDLAFASGLWFLTFALMQLPVGEALDRIGPRRTATTLFLFGGAGGAALFAMASAPWHIAAAMVLIGMGCSPVLMASFFIFSRMYPAAMFATLGSVMIGVGSLGNIAGTLPLAMAIDAFGWRETLWVLSGFSALLAVGVYVTVQDPERTPGPQTGSVLDLLKLRALWPIFPMLLVNYLAAGGLRGLWVGPYLADVYGATNAVVGQATLYMGLAMIVGTFVYGPLDRWLGTRKWVIFGGNLLGLLAIAALAYQPLAGYWPSVLLIAAIGFFGMSFPVIMAHARAFVPPHLAGRGVTLMNLFGIGGVGLFQVATSRVFRATEGPDVAVHLPYQAVFTLFAVSTAIGLALYLFAQDRTD